MRDRARPLLFTLALLSLAVPLPAQGIRQATSAYSRGRPLSEWILQADHYIPDMRREAVRAIAALGPSARVALPVLLRATRDDTEEVRFWAVEAIRRIGPAATDAVPALLVVLADDVRRVQLLARTALEAVGPAAVPALIPALRNPDPWVRANAAEALGAIGASGGGQAVKPLARLLADDSLWVRASAGWALGHLGASAKPAVKPLTNALQEELRHDPELRTPARRVRVEQYSYALGRIGPAAGEAVPGLLSVFFDGGDSLRIVAAAALAGVGARAAPALGQALTSERMATRIEAAHGLRLMGPQGKKAVPALIRVLETTDELEGGHDLLVATADALGSIGKSAKGALGALAKARKKNVSPDVVAALDRATRKIRAGG
ncbi:MAG: HEAT repeat domain-containing protein [Gemmatimonadota bacterium]|nr:HEAT repeat domain-containing protein [Gemmatimonadota bacterium]